MGMQAFRSRFFWAHLASVLSCLFVLTAAGVFVLCRIWSGSVPLPVRNVETVVATVNSDVCDCVCDAATGALSCVGRPTEFPMASCIRAHSQRTVRWIDCHCSTSPLGPIDGQNQTLSCKVATFFQHDGIRWVRHASMFQLCLCFFVFLWDVHCLAAIYWHVIPVAPEHDVNMDWFHHWLQAYADPLHVAAMWTIWCNVLSVSFALPGSRYPNPRQYAPHGTRLHANWGPTGLDELAVWVALLFFVASGIFTVCTVQLRTSDSEDGKGDEGPTTDAVQQAQERQGRGLEICFLLFLFLAASSGCVLGQPLSSFHAVLLSLPLFWQAYHANKSTWPLERPFPLCGSMWALPEHLSRQHDEGLAVLSELLVGQGSAGRDAATAVKFRSLCRIVVDILRSHPWRAPTELHMQLKAALLSAIRSTLDARNPDMLPHLLRSAVLLGYMPPVESAEEADLDMLPASSGSCLCCPWGYQRLGGKESEGEGERRPSHDEQWYPFPSAEIHDALRGGLRSAAQSANMLGDEASFAWLGACLAALHPGAVAGLSAQLAQAAHCLSMELSAEENLARDEVCHVLSNAVARHPDVDGDNNRTAFGQALRLPTHLRRGSLAAMLDQIPCRAGGPPPADEECSSRELAIISGSASTIHIQDFTALCSHHAAVVGAPGLAVPQAPGRWFFEARVLGHAPSPAKPGGIRIHPRVGWLHLDEAPCRSGTGKSSALSPGVVLDHTSCSIDSLVAKLWARPPGEQQVGQELTLPGHGVVGCALEVAQNSSGALTYKAWFALDGDWGVVGISQKAIGRYSMQWSERSRYLRRASPSPLIPCVSGRMACEFLFAGSEFIFGPPDVSFRPLLEAATIQDARVVDSGQQMAVQTYGNPTHDSSL